MDLSRQYRFFHWHVEFPHIFRVDNGTSGIDPAVGWSGGFSCVIGNPPWERIAVEDEQFFARRARWVLNETTTARRKAAIETLKSTHPNVFDEYVAEQHRTAAVGHLVTDSRRYPRTSVGRLTTQALFAGLGLEITGPSGFCGFILPTGVIADVPMKDFWNWLVTHRRINRIIDFENRNRIFPIHRSTKFALLTFPGVLRARNLNKLSVGTYFVSLGDLQRRDRIYSFPIDKLSVISPLTNQLPICRTQRDVEILIKAIEGAKPALAVIPWVGFTSEGSSHTWQEVGGADSLPLYEGKMIHQFDCCFATYEGVDERAKRNGNPREMNSADKNTAPIPRFYASKLDVQKFLKRKGIVSDWICVYRDYVRAADQRTAISSVVPRSVPIQPLNGFTISQADAATHAWAIAAINSFAYDFIAKQKTPGQHFNVTTMSQVPVPAMSKKWRELVIHGVAELSYIIAELRDFAVELGYEGEPFLWDEGRRELIRCEIDAVFCHLYGLDRIDVSYIMETFPIVQRKDEQRYGKYRTKELILDIYDAMAEAIRVGKPYQTILDPPPGRGPRRQDPRGEV